ncbi:MAG: DUF6045 family protein [Oscillospiraceae bacterium]|nr:DUF6045 family protein [Oscillospiraceae bacterium]
MFLFDWIAGNVMQEILNWFFARIFEFLSTFFSYINYMGAEIFDLPWIQTVTTFFSYFGWALFGVGMIVAIFDCAIESQNGRITIRETALNILKGFIACGIFTTVPIALYRLAVSLQLIFAFDLIGVFEAEINNVGSMATHLLQGDFFLNLGLYTLFMMIVIGYCVIKVFFANIKRGGILLTSIAIGSLYMFSVPRGYTDGFMTWCKQVIGLCFMAFMQTTLLIAGLVTSYTNILLGIGIMLASSEVPRIAGQFGLDTSTRCNPMGAVFAAQSVINVTKSLAAKSAGAK